MLILLSPSLALFEVLNAVETQESNNHKKKESRSDTISYTQRLLYYIRH